MTLFTQDRRHIRISSPLGRDALLVESFSGSEAMSRLYSYELSLVSENQGIAFNEIIGASVTLALELPWGRKRFFNGIVSRFSQVSASGTAEGDIPDLPANLVQFNPEHVCLYRGELEPDMAAVAPYLALLERDTPFTEWVLYNGWGEHWGIFGSAGADLPALRRHFRSFTAVIDHSGKTLLFRFYDPRVWREYLRTCNRKELEKFFGPVCNYYQEGEEVGVIVRLALLQGELHEEEIMLG